MKAGDRLASSFSGALVEPIVSSIPTILAVMLEIPSQGFIW